MAGAELIRVTDRRAGALAAQERAFPRDPSLANDTPDPAGTVGPETAPTTAAGAPVGAEPVIVDGDALAAAMPSKGLVPSAWAGLPSDWTPAWSNGAGVVGDPVLNKRVSTVFTCVDLNGSALGSMPVQLAEGGRPINPETHDWTVNPEPRIYSSWDEFIVQWYASLATRGDAFIHATDWDWDTFLPSRFMVLDPDQVTVQFDANGMREYRLNGAELYAPDVLHTRYMTVAGWPNGLSPLQGAAGNLRSAGALEQYGADLAERGGIPWGTITSEQRITERQATLAQERWVEAAARRRGAPAVLGSGMKLDTLNLNPRDMALLELRVFDEQRISAAFGVPAFLLNLDQPSGMTYSNVTSLFDFHWRRLRPVAKRLTNALSAWALPRGRTCHLNASDYITPTLQERTPAYAALADHDALTVNEWRAIEALPPLPGADVPLSVYRQRLSTSQPPQQDTSATVAAITAGGATLQ